MKNNISVRLFSAATAFALLVSATGIVSLASAAPPEVTTLPATSITSSNATLNAHNGDTATTDSMFWVSTSTIVTPTPSGSANAPSGVYATTDLGAQAINAPFSASLSSITGILPVTASTTYYFVAYTYVGGIWHPGEVLSFATLPSAPTVTGIAPTTGTTTGGTTVTITGTNLSGATAVKFGATVAAITANTGTSITATSPATTTAGIADVMVTTAGGTSATSSADQFTYVAPAASAPTVSSVSPTSGTTAGGTTVTITGTNLSGATAVKFGSLTAATTTNTGTSITATSPATTTAGIADVTVTTAGGTSATSSADQFTYVAPLAPVITNIAAVSTTTTTATITWNTNLPASSQVSYGTTASYTASSTLNTTATTSHSVILTGLAEATLYHFDVSSANAVGTTTSSDQTFVTQSTASSTPLHVDGTTPGSTSATADDTYVHGWSWMMHLTVPDSEAAFRMKFSDWTGSAGSFATANNVRIFSAQSSNANSESTAITETNNNYGGWLYLTGDTATSTAGRQIDLTIQVKIPSGTPAGSYSTNFGAQSVPTSATSTTP